jgi:hypothetical protein
MKRCKYSIHRDKLPKGKKLFYGFLPDTYKNLEYGCKWNPLWGDNFFSIEYMCCPDPYNINRNCRLYTTAKIGIYDIILPVNAVIIGVMGGLLSCTYFTRVGSVFVGLITGVISYIFMKAIITANQFKNHKRRKR